MFLFPAIDLKDGACVRLKLGLMEESTVFNTDPGAQARDFAAAGAEWIHVVDLNGAFAGKPVNGAAVDSILKSVSVPVQLGGGIREMATIEDWLARGIRRVILGTVALKNPALVKEACQRFPGRVAVGIDAKGGKVAVEGWAETSDLTVLELARKFEDCGVAALIYTDIDRDGVLAGPNVAATAALADAISIPVIASGGVSSLVDLKALKAYPKLEGVISGRAIYDGRIDVAQAIALLKA
ncbi:1-(5-phosphoribosyl)-5-[(5-phosphoribosylamino)methylideneamino]imidazole-4-carboxamide isomerase [Paramagnetospirillum magneticum]|uniref:1-(5-phosphoribosyl)-5-[(5-phosphoribosylamino)methylideneamino] imidazole-4-carboxamide isomerase n=1 Tax=Paramagnetospirillum magneticum (strain ATCC 700264 / AMB-1) TaxID=342108 RepID=HIS4_PARM1|nr:1-(5-phosphoribosyl)-5-[(5-phosphoribosylamino)methylideneamino]imidazole-4-carboxamide isomerase [Paramagnetospirillum magneticum]Q2VYI9.1 RecName: Full=1-(5-phosphoribosyl)-5-[(5-phosphoribosylamino)methylideneamino] imidazole-4-carboxamide isomerase; AltName: Full=Phosphoribosylformimino-5-aminoimidazole carboxamide ribotide isomerase [Paramagnetospirillum magneticum AMB-1]BAE53336.1 Phosphoribosylformimino-5-aminoimidazole carboxamide ribonucleotide isomerase [Paramagnetospirillum magnetic